MIRSTYVKILADSCGVVTDDDVNAKIAAHCETKLRRLLEAAQKHRQSLPRRKFTTDDLNNVLQSTQNAPPITTIPRYNPLTVTYTSMSTTITPTFPIGYVFAANTTSTLTNAAPTTYSNTISYEPLPLNSSSASTVRVRDVLFAQDRLVSTQSLLQRTRAYILSPKMSLHLHYSSVCNVQPFCIENPTKDEIISLLSYQFSSPLTQSQQQQQPHNLISRETNKQLIIQQRLQQLSQLIIIPDKPGSTSHIYQSSSAHLPISAPNQQNTNQHKINFFNERNLLNKIPIPAGSQIVLLKQESILSLTTEELSLLRAIFSTLSTSTTEKIIFPTSYFYPALPLVEFSSPYHKPTSAHPTITTPPLFELNTFISNLIPIFVIPAHQHATFSNIIKSNHLNNLLPKIFNHLSSQISSLQALDQIMTQLRFIFALLSNPTLNFEPYLAQILSILIPLLISKQISPFPKPVEYALHDYYSHVNIHYPENAGRLSIISAAIRGIPALKIQSATQSSLSSSSTSTIESMLDITVLPSTQQSTTNALSPSALLQYTPTSQSISISQLPPQFIQTLPEPRVRQFTAVILYQLIKRFVLTYPSLQTRISNVLFSLLSNFHLNHSTSSIPHNHHQQSSSQLASTSTGSYTNEEDDEVDLISSTQTAVAHQQQQQYFNAFNYYNPTPSTIVSTQFTTNVAPISHYCALLFIQQYAPHTIFEQYSSAFPTIYKYYFQLLHIPIPSWSPSTPRRTFTSQFRHVTDLTALQQTHQHHRLQASNSSMAPTSTSTPLSSTYSLQHFHHSTLTLHLLFALIKMTCTQIVSTHPHINALINRLQSNHLIQEANNISWIAQQRNNERTKINDQFYQQSRSTHPADLCHFQQYPTKEMKLHRRVALAQEDIKHSTSRQPKLSTSLFHKKSKSTFNHRHHPDTAGMSFREMFNYDNDSDDMDENDPNYGFTEPCLLNTTQSLNYTPLSSSPAQFSNPTSSCQFTNLFELIPNTAALPDATATFSFTTLSRPF